MQLSRRFGIISAGLVPFAVFGMRAVHAPDALTGFAGGVLIGLGIVFGVRAYRRGRC